MLCSKIKSSLPNVDICLLQGGAVRGRSDYAPGPFTYGDLMNELAFQTEIATIQLPGHVIAESVQRSRSDPSNEHPTFLHHDNDAAFEPFPSLQCLSINKQPFEPDRMYTVSIYHVLVVRCLPQFRPQLLIPCGLIQPQVITPGPHLYTSPPFSPSTGVNPSTRPPSLHHDPQPLFPPATPVWGLSKFLHGCVAEQVGMNEVQPLLSYIQRSGMRVPSLNDTIPAKQLVVEACMREQWLSLAAQIERQGAPVGGKDKLVQQLFYQLDKNRDGRVSKAELSEYLSKRSGKGVEFQPCEQLLVWLISTLDSDHDGYLSIDELG